MWRAVKILPTDYASYGGTIERWADDKAEYPDCSSGCAYYRRLISEYDECEDADWGVCINHLSPRSGLLTFEHQAGLECFTKKKIRR